jgi:hypothetical protein
MLDACGPFPDLDLEEAGTKEERAAFRKEMSAYVKKVLAWQAKQKK